MRRYWENYLGLYEEALGRKLDSGTISNIDIDSYESGKGTWTLRMEEEFEQRRGYSMALWLPALAGERIGTDEERERFLFDWRQTLGELLAENHYDLATEIFHSRGIKRYSESHEERRTFTGDGMMVKRTADVPQGAFWVRFRAGVYATMPHMEADLRESSSVAHIYGQNISAAEAVVKAFVPLAEQFGYVTVLRTLSSGRATSTMSFDHYAEVPANLSKEIVEKSGYSFRRFDDE